MKVSEVDFYTGFEWESELLFTYKKNDCENRLRLREGYFDTMMSYVNPSVKGEWESLAYYYNLCLGCWGDNQENWQIPSIEEALQQLQGIELLGEDIETSAALDALIVFFKQSIDNNIHVFITRF